MNEIPETFTPPAPNKDADIISVIGFGTAMCTAIKDPKAQGDCRGLIEPLEDGKKDPIDVLADLLLQNPDGVDEASDRFNYNMQEAVKRAEERLKAKNAT